MAIEPVLRGHKYNILSIGADCSMPLDGKTIQKNT